MSEIGLLLPLIRTRTNGIFVNIRLLRARPPRAWVKAYPLDGVIASRALVSSRWAFCCGDGCRADEKAIRRRAALTSVASLTLSARSASTGAKDAAPLPHPSISLSRCVMTNVASLYRLGNPSRTEQLCSRTDGGGTDGAARRRGRSRSVAT
ncbi:hypothetical protein M433DRAFT_506367 [Acidomyces richmondensis BFW]|nr:hypothetical protein M433DRAFT_506367 [Acidomyces richmondensis BFW]